MNCDECGHPEGEHGDRSVMACTSGELGPFFGLRTNYVLRGVPDRGRYCYCPGWSKS